MANIKIIDQIKRSKGDDGSGVTYDTFMLGPQLKYIDKLKTSNTNNFEEMFLLGADKITKKWTDSKGTEIEVTEFRRDNDTQGFYILTINKYNQSHAEDNIYIGDHDNMVFNKSMNATYDADNKKIKIPNAEGMRYDSNNKTFIFPSELVLEQHYLTYKRALNVAEEDKEVDVAKKDITSYIITEDNVNKTVIKETVTPLGYTLTKNRK